MQKNLLSAILILMISLCTVSCTRNAFIYHGYTFNDVSNLKEKVQDFKDSRANSAKVIDVLGSPTLTEILQNNQKQNRKDFFYVENVFVRKPFVGDYKVNTKVLIICFDYEDKVKDFIFIQNKEKNLFDDSMKTTIKGKEMKFFEQIKKNITNTK